MIVTENESLARHTTFHIGGPARFFITCESTTDVADAVAFAKSQKRALLPLGGGSNVLVPDDGVEGVVTHIAIPGIYFEDTGDTVLVRVGAGVRWHDVVLAAVERNLWGIENLATIPGTMGGAVVQNIGAYGTELSNVFSEARVCNTETLLEESIDLANAAFGYRTSLFKTNRNYIVLEATLRLEKKGTPIYGYADLAGFADENPQASPREIAAAVTQIRERKFPSHGEEGTAGSFFKNPVVDEQTAAILRTRFPELPQRSQEHGGVKIPLAWILDNVLGLKGYEQNGVRLFEQQPLVLVARPGTTAAAVDALASDIGKRVADEVGISIEREVETFKK